jgi:hypothetical protein
MDTRKSGKGGRQCGLQASSRSWVLCRRSPSLRMSLMGHTTGGGTSEQARDEAVQRMSPHPDQAEARTTRRDCRATVSARYPSAWVPCFCQGIMGGQRSTSIQAVLEFQHLRLRCAGGRLSRIDVLRRPL